MKVALGFVLLLFLQLGACSSEADEELKSGQVSIDRNLRYYEIRADPMIIQIDRHSCYDSRVSCFCYKGDNNGADDAEGCGLGYSSICISGKYGDFLLYTSGETVNLRTMEFSKGAAVITAGKKAKDGEPIPTIAARTNEYCAKIKLYNVYPSGVDSAVQSGVVAQGCTKCACVV
uniref:Lipoprotein n=1 Tax=Panagrolaimus sp. JU765 TaxID=591449 RepID=A0AC34QR27_9BILA